MPCAASRHRLLALIGLALAAGNAAAQPANSPAGAVERAYTPLDLAKCSHKPGREVEDYGSWRCAGYDGNFVFVSAGDQRTYISYGPNAANEPSRPARRSRRSTARARPSNGASSAGTASRVPFATILRWNTTVTQDNGDSVRGQVLVVTRLGPGGVCHVGYVDGRANPNANELAVQTRRHPRPHFQVRQGQAGDRRRKRPGLQRAVQRLASRGFDALLHVMRA